MHAVLVLDHAHVNGGQAKVAIESALGLAARGHRVTVFAAVAPVDPRLASAGIEVVCLGQDDVTTARNPAAFAVQAIWNAPAARRLGEVVAGLDPSDTVVHVHAFAKALSPSIGRPLAASGLTAIYTMHEFFLVCPNGGFYDYPAGGVCTRVPMSGACMARNCDARSYPRKLLRVARHAGMSHVARLPEAFRHIVLISDLQARVAGPYLPSGARLHRIDNPIAVPDPGPKGEGRPGGFLFVGRLSAEKGVGHFLEAARRAGVTPTLVGDGPEADGIRSRYPEAVMLGWKPAEEVRSLMREARALVFPSVWYEGQPLTVLEALAVGTPVIVSDVCAGREAVADGVNGLWFRSGDADDLARALRTLQDDATARRMGAAAHERYWAAPLTPERHVDRLEALYAEALGRAPAPVAIAAE
ncbi:MAG TPA: glycosyltransferase family 4 protein [Salinarimonas sp.]|nr:glycosyltransferase family 4 protein [Salinarimonas sp.]